VVTSQNQDIHKKLEQMKRERDNLEKTNKELDAKLLELYSLYNISKALHLSIAVEDIFSGILHIVGKTLQIDDFCIMLFDEDRQELVMRACYPDADNLSNVRFKTGEGVSGTVAKTGEPALVQDVSLEPKFMFYKGAKTDIGAFMCVPLIGRYGDILGVLNIHKGKPNSLTDHDTMFFREVGEQIAVTIERALIYEKTKEASIHDDLTGLYNRKYFFEYLETELARGSRHGKCFSILMVDIDHFKNFNDKNGHLKGDDALKQTARLLVNTLRCSDVVARYGGEEFVCLLPETSKNIAVVASEKLRKVVEGSAYVGGENQPGGRLTITIGVSTWPDDARVAAELVDYADKALYLGKSRGRNMVIDNL